MGSGKDGVFHISDGDLDVLCADRNDDGRRLNTNWDKPDNRWNDEGLFAFLASATLLISHPASLRG